MTTATIPVCPCCGKPGYVVEVYDRLAPTREHVTRYRCTDRKCGERKRRNDGLKRTMWEEKK